MATLVGSQELERWSGTPLARRSSRVAPLRKAFEISRAHAHFQIVTDDLPPGWRP
jgi:hypothetical protein